MSNESGSARNLFKRRLGKEKAISEEEIAARMRWDLPVLSTNQKCSISLDLPFLNCAPTDICAQVCYAAQGRQYYRKSVVKALAIDRLIQLDPEHVARKMVDEAAGRNIRIAGSGEALPNTLSFFPMSISSVAPTGESRAQVDTHQAIPSFMYSLDASTPAYAL